MGRQGDEHTNRALAKHTHDEDSQLNDELEQYLLDNDHALEEFVHQVHMEYSIRNHFLGQQAAQQHLQSTSTIKDSQRRVGRSRSRTLQRPSSNSRWVTFGVLSAAVICVLSGIAAITMADAESEVSEFATETTQNNGSDTGLAAKRTNQSSVDWASVEIFPDSSYTSPNVNGPHWTLDHGSMTCRIDPGRVDGIFQVQTPAAQIQVVGTTFEVHHDKDKTSLAVSTGMVQFQPHRSATRWLVGPGGSVMTSGEAVSVSAGIEYWSYVASDGPPIEAWRSGDWQGGAIPAVHATEMNRTPRTFSVGTPMLPDQLMAPWSDQYRVRIRFRSKRAASINIIAQLMSDDTPSAANIISSEM